MTSNKSRSYFVTLIKKRMALWLTSQIVFYFNSLNKTKIAHFLKPKQIRLVWCAGGQYWYIDTSRVLLSPQHSCRVNFDFLCVKTYMASNMILSIKAFRFRNFKVSEHETFKADFFRTWIFLFISWHILLPNLHFYQIIATSISIFIKFAKTFSYWLTVTLTSH